MTKGGASSAARTQRADQSRSEPLTSRVLVFRILAILLPFLVLAAFEAALRLKGYGGYPPLIKKAVQDGNATWYATNRKGTDTFFATGGTQTGGMRELQFLTPKPAGTVRILMIGESAIQGFPQILPLTDGSFLEAMLQDAWNDGRRVEVLNLGATAVASFPAVEILKEALAQEPDLVILMAGNNEFYGAWGMLALPAFARSPHGMTAYRYLGRIALLQWLQGLRKATQPGTLMERMGHGMEVSPDAPLRRAAAVSLEAQLTRAVRLCHSRNVPVILCTVPTNEKGLAPIGGATALAHYRKARALSGAGRDAAALPEYVTARDLDTMPWRATSAAQAAIRKSASSGAVLCDVEAAFRAESPGGAIGWDLMDDHVHMTVKGQALFARTIVATLASFPGVLHVDRERLHGLPAWDTYARRLGWSPYSEIFTLRNMKSIFDIPFMKQNNAGARSRFEATYDSLLATLDPSDRAAIERWQDPSLHGATDRPLEFLIGLNRLESGDAAEAIVLFRTARASLPALSLWRLETTWHLLAASRVLHDQPTPEDLDLLAETIHLGRLLVAHGGADNPRVHRYLGLALNLAGDFRNSLPSLERAMTEPDPPWDLIRGLADTYVQVGRIGDARSLLARAAERPATAVSARKMLQQIGG